MTPSFLISWSKQTDRKRQDSKPDVTFWTHTSSGAPRVVPCADRTAATADPLLVSFHQQRSLK